MRAIIAVLSFVLAVAAVAPTSGAAAGRPTPVPSIVRLTTGGTTIPVLRTARGITTMLTLPDEAREAICGDLYDAQTNTGGFVIQRSGRDLFIKPLRAAAESNLFVKTETSTFSFDLAVVEPARAMRVVFVAPHPVEKPRVADAERLRRERAELDTLRASLEAEIAQRRAALDAESATRAETLARDRVAVALARDGDVTILDRMRTRSASLEAELGPAIVRLGSRSFVRCTVRNAGNSPIALARADVLSSRPAPPTSALRASDDRIARTLAPGERMVFVLAFDDPLAKGTVIVIRGAGGAPLATFKPL